jgi:hypothetical protein
VKSRTGVNTVTYGSLHGSLLLTGVHYRTPVRVTQNSTQKLPARQLIYSKCSQVQHALHSTRVQQMNAREPFYEGENSRRCVEMFLPSEKNTVNTFSETHEFKRKQAVTHENSLQSSDLPKIVTCELEKVQVNFEKPQ